MSEYRIDDLARMAGTTVRNVRVYQDRGLLAPPRRVGRVGWYAEAQLARLRLIGRLLDRGFTLALIAELISAWEQGRNLADILGVEEALTQPWSTEVPERVTLRELRRRFGEQANTGAIRRATELGLIRRSGVSFTVPSPRLLSAGEELVGLGVPMTTVLDLAEGLAQDLDVTARRFVAVVIERVLGDASKATFPPQERLAAIADIVQRLRPQATIAVEASFATAMERQVAEAFSEIAGRTVSREAERPATG
ncbi:MAG TPA: MerR family transcriptional regulator [Frankiaceae bacterium]|nr:MerR family transcriptional regulator [Frankiaceae bacterium]